MRGRAKFFLCSDTEISGLSSLLRPLKVTELFIYIYKINHKILQEVFLQSLRRFTHYDISKAYNKTVATPLPWTF